MNAAKITLVSTVVAAALGLVLGLLVAPAQAHCPHQGEIVGTHCAAGDSEVRLEIKYEVGDLTNDPCVQPGDEPDCATTTITVDGTLECGNSFCVFVGEVNTDFFLPEGLRTLLDEVAWRGVELDPTLCYDYDPVFESLGTLTVTNVLLRSGPDSNEGWLAHVSGTANDDVGDVDRSYEFIFRGGCDEPCPDLQNLVGQVTFESGSLQQINAPLPKKKDEKALPEGEAFGTACRCTMSSTPDCPDDVVDGFGVPIDSPPIRVTVTDVTP